MSVRFLASAWAELGWWVRLLGRMLRRRPGQVVVLVAACWFVQPYVSAFWLLVPVVVIAALRVWVRWRPRSFQRWMVAPVRGTWGRWWVRRHWQEIAERCGLGVYRPPPRYAHGVGAAMPAESAVTVSRLVAVRGQGPRITLRVRPLLGQTYDDIERAGEQLRTAVAATRVRVEPHRANEALVTLTLGDSLADAFDARRPTTATAPRTDRVWLGHTESGGDWWLPVGPHTLVAGCSGAGKVSVFWSFAFGLAPGVKAGTVRLHGVDLKGGMEVLMGAGLFTTRATDAAQAVTVLEELVRRMQARTSQYAGHVRSHTPSNDEPLHVVMIDELAALTAYCPQRDLQRRAEMALNLLCSQGRAPGFMVFACLQDPRKEVIPSRGLFTQMVGLRLKDTTETAMVLGEAALTAGAHCERIARTTPGMGYVVPEDAGYPVRVRAGYACDDLVRSVAAEFATPVQEDIEVPEPDESLGSRRPRPRHGMEVA